jgi:predicted short-subunit dehydrogenase-like oxidoreductase (DUF2520 family)
MSLSVIIIGAGNLATHLATALFNTGISIVQVYSRTEEAASELAGKVSASWTTDDRKIDQNADLYILALKDSVVREFLEKSDLQNKLLVHCAGSLPLSLLQEFSANCGVIYPLQTFSKTRPVDFSGIPVFIEASSPCIRDLIMETSQLLTSRTFYADSHQRLLLHISAVFACNFVNHFYAIAASVLEDAQLEFDHLRPLIMETCMKTGYMHPFDAQTGPAVRNDQNVISIHLAALDPFPEIRELYRHISQHISTLHQK